MIRQLSVGPIGENVYIIDRVGSPVVVFDPGAESERVLKETIAAMERSAAASVLVVATHGHLDHVAALPALVAGLSALGVAVRVFAPAGDRDYFGDKAYATNERVFEGIHAAAFFKKQWNPIPEADEYYEDGFVLPGTDMEAIHTPGHTRGSSCFLVDGGSSLIAGDTLFRDGRGRTDNFDADEATIIQSIRDRLCVLHDAVRVWPGHGDSTTIGREKRNYL